MNRKIARGSRRKTKAPLFILLAMILIVIAIIVTIFTMFFMEDIDKKPNFVIGVNNSSKESKPSSTPSSAPPSSETPSSAPVVPPIVSTTIVPESEAVDKSYFDDAVFIGDSISKGLKLYGVLPSQNVIADQNVGLDQIARDKPVYYNVAGEKETLFQALKATPVAKNKIYILLGSNGLPGYENVDHIKYYEKTLDKIMETYPNATIYVQSVTPISKQAEADYKKRNKVFTNKKINEFNEMLLKLAEKKKVYYLNVREALLDKDGYLNSDYYSPTGDGVHFVKSGHEAMYRYYKTHTVRAEAPKSSEPTTDSTASTAAQE